MDIYYRSTKKIAIHGSMTFCFLSCKVSKPTGSALIEFWPVIIFFLSFVDEPPSPLPPSSLPLQMSGTATTLVSLAFPVSFFLSVRISVYVCIEEPSCFRVLGFVGALGSTFR